MLNKVLVGFGYAARREKLWLKSLVKGLQASSVGSILDEKIK